MGYGNPQCVGTAGLGHHHPLAPFPPREELPTAVVGVALVIVIFVSFCLICTRDPPYEQWLIGVGVGAIPFVVVGAWPLAPSPPCERVLAVVGDGCWGIASLLPRTLVVDIHNPPYEQALIGTLFGVAVVHPWRHLPLRHLTCVLNIGTHDPPYEQGFVGMGRGLVVLCWFWVLLCPATQASLSHPWGLVFPDEPLTLYKVVENLKTTVKAN